MRRTKLDYMGMFGIGLGMHYHAFDKAVQVCNGCYELYEKSKNDEERELNFSIAQKIARTMNPPIPIESYNPRFLEKKYK